MLAWPAFALAGTPDVEGSELALDFSTYPPKAHQERINTYRCFPAQPFPKPPPPLP